MYEESPETSRSEVKVNLMIKESNLHPKVLLTDEMIPALWGARS